MYQTSTYFRSYLNVLRGGSFKRYVSVIFEKACDSQEWCNWGYDYGMMPWSRHAHPEESPTRYHHLVGGMSVKEVILTCVELNIVMSFYYKNIEYQYADNLHDNSDWFDSTALLCLRNGNVRYFLVLLPFTLVPNTQSWNGLRQCRDYINNNTILPHFVNSLLSTRSRRQTFRDVSAFVLNNRWRK